MLIEKFFFLHSLESDVCGAGTQELPSNIWEHTAIPGITEIWKWQQLSGDS